MPLVSATCPRCGAATYVSLPADRAFVATEPASTRPDLVEDETACGACGERFPFVHGPR